MPYISLSCFRLLWQQNGSKQIIQFPGIGTAGRKIDAASDRAVQVVELHRQDIIRLQREEQRLLKELGDNHKKLWVGQFQGEVITKEFGITVTERASAFQALTSSAHKRIQLERQAYNVDEAGNRPDPITEITINLVLAQQTINE